jgi:hypothetical protein
VTIYLKKIEDDIRFFFRRENNYSFPFQYIRTCQEHGHSMQMIGVQYEAFKYDNWSEDGIQRWMDEVRNAPMYCCTQSNLTKAPNE